MKRAMVNEQNVETVQKNNWRRTRIIIVVTFAAALTFCNATAQLDHPVHYVSTNGSNTYPYDTWPTAARSVQTAINATEPGDTVQIGQGVFRGTFTARADLTISGMGSDKTIINGGSIDQTATVVTAPGFCRVWNLKIMCDTHYGGRGISAPDGVDMRNCEINGFPEGYMGNWGTGFSIAANSFVDNCRFVGNKYNAVFGGGGSIQNSVFENSAWGLDPEYAQVSGCIFFGCGTGIVSIESRVVNCLFYGNGTAIEVTGGVSSFSNCTIVGNNVGYAHHHYGSQPSTLKNSIICNNTEYGITDPYVSLSHNDVWNNGRNYLNCSPDAGSISLNPRFVSNTAYLSHTGAGQPYNSPCVDAGDSDIGQNPLLVGLTTRTDNIPDTGVVDMGYHYRPPMGSLQVTIAPPEVRSVGAQWRRVGTTTWRNSSYTESDVPAGPQTVEFKSVGGWNTPANVSVTITDGQTTTVNGPAATYTQQPVVVIVPQSKTAGVGTDVTFNTEVSGTPPFSYQWSFNGTNRLGATNTSLVLTNVQLTQAGQYAVVVSNAAGSATSAATLIVGSVWLDVVGPPTNGVLPLLVHGDAGKRCEVWASTNLMQWALVSTVTNATGTVNFTDPITNRPCRFYRLRQLP